MIHSHQCVGSDAQQANIIKCVEDGIWGIVAVFDAHPPFAYTVGLHAQGLPEIIVFGPFRHETVAVIINMFGCKSQRDGAFNHGYIDTDKMMVPTAFLDCDDTVKGQFMYQAIKYYGHEDFRVQQLVWSDKQGLFPWDANSAFNSGQQFDGLQPIYSSRPLSSH